MRQTLLLAFLTLNALFGLQAQTVAPIAQLTLEADGKAIYLHGNTGIPIIQTNINYTAVNPVTHQVMWSRARTEGAALMSKLNDNQVADYIELSGTPYIFLAGSVLNAATGEVIVDGEADSLKNFANYYIIPEAELVLVEIVGKKKIRLYGIDPFAGKQKWAINLREIGGLAQLAAMDEPVAPSLDPLLTATGDLLYHNDKYLASIDLQSGSLRWNEKLNPGYIYLNDDATKLLVAEKRGGLGGLMEASSGGSSNTFSKKLHLLDAATGTSLWSKGESKMEGNIQFIMPYEDGFAVVHDEGFNIYDYSPGKEATGRWKKDYEEKGINNISVEEEGLLLYFKNKRMLIDPSTGDELWKKAEKLERDAPSYSMGSRSRAATVAKSSFYSIGSSMYVEVNGITRTYPFQIFSIDKSNNRLILAYQVPAVGSSYNYSINAIDLNTGQSKRGSVDLRKSLDGIDPVSNNGYFFYNDRGFTLMRFEDKQWSEVKSAYYPDPTRGERFLTDAVVGTALGTAAARSSVGGTKAVLTNDQAAYEAYERKMNTVNEAQNAANAMNSRRIVGRVDQTFAFFFARNDAGNLVLFKVDKKSGEEVKQYPFEDKTPVYEVDNANQQLYYLVEKELKIFGL